MRYCRRFAIGYKHYNFTVPAAFTFQESTGALKSISDVSVAPGRDSGYVSHYGIFPVRRRNNRPAEVVESYHSYPVTVTDSVFCYGGGGKSCHDKLAVKSHRTA